MMMIFELCNTQKLNPVSMVRVLMISVVLQMSQVVPVYNYTVMNNTYNNGSKWTQAINKYTQIFTKQDIESQGLMTIIKHY